MRFLPRLLLTLTALLPLAAHAAEGPKRLAPVSVGIAIESGSYVLGETLPVRVLVRNNTPAPLTLGKGDHPAGAFEVIRHGDPQQRNLAREPKGCLPKPLTLKPNEERVFDLDLSVAADDPPPPAVDIGPGAVVLEGTQPCANDPTRQRHFTLVRWPRDHVDRLFLRVQDTPDGRFFPTVMLGAYLPLVTPRLNISPAGEIVVLHRATPEFYVRNVFWSLPAEFVRRSTQSLLDPATADTERLNGMRADLDAIIQKNESQRKADHDKIERIKANNPKRPLN